MKKSSGKVSINDVARLAKVSSMTVSRVLSHPEEVREKTREEVMRVIRETAYRKDVFASNNSKKRSRLSREKTILINCRMENLSVSGDFAFYPVVYFALMKGILNRSYRTVLTDLEAHPGHFVNAGECDAVVLCGPVNRTVRDFISPIAKKTPVLTLCAGSEYSYSVDPDDRFGGEIAAKIFFERGHRHLAVVGSPEPNHILRAESFKNFLQNRDPKAQVDILNAELTREKEKTDQNFDRELAEYFKSVKKYPTGLFVTSGYGAHQVLRCLKQKKMRIPEDISFLGCDDGSFYEAGEVPVGRVWFDPAEIGSRASDLLVRILEGKSISEKKVLIPMILTEGASVKQI